MNTQEFYEKKIMEYEQCTNDGHPSHIRIGHFSAFEVWLMDELYKHEVLTPEINKLPKAEIKPNHP